MTPKKVQGYINIQPITEENVTSIPVQLLNKPDDVEVFVKPNQVSLTVVGGLDAVANILPEDILVTIDFKDWNVKKQFYSPSVKIPDSISKWENLTPNNLEILVVDGERTNQRKLIILGIETSCDETGVAICDNYKILAIYKKTQYIHKKYGGVVPEIASREHEKFLPQITKRVLKESKLNYSDLDAIAVTNGPGLMGSLLSGVSFAKGLSQGLNFPQ
ncbi:MAG: hypothetical protein CM1200mP31_6610 [Candidatus Neomarinimicrobiota bacterium]|nr:MAG: hypothetical protein CM1200mP31_6610 [Candidatus Neomarinimicrobiota bacterium]